MTGLLTNARWNPRYIREQEILNAAELSLQEHCRLITLKKCEVIDIFSTTKFLKAQIRDYPEAVKIYSVLARYR